jgi:subtilase family serine protease
MKNLSAFIIATMLLVLSFSSSLSLSSIPATDLVAVAGTQPSQLKSIGNYTISPASYNPEHQLTVVVSFASGSLSHYLDLVSNPSSIYFHQFLTPMQLAALLQNQQAVQQAESYFQSYGLTAIPSVTGLTMVLQGTAAQFSNAFHTGIGAFNMTSHSRVWNPVFASQRSVTFYANTGQVFLPSQLAAEITGISGLEGAIATPQLMMPAELLNFKPSNTSVSVSPASKQVSNSAAVNITNGYYGWYNACYYFGACFGTSPNEQMFFPSTIPALVGAKNLWQQGYTGKGITIAVVEVGCIDPSILKGFSQQTFGNTSLLDRFTQIAIAQNTLSQCIQNGWNWGWTLETALDIEYAAAMAPQAHIDLIGVPDPLFSSFDFAYQYISSSLAPGSTCSVPGYVTVYDGYGNQLTQLPQGSCPVDITSHSYGAGETYTTYFGSPMYITVENSLIESMALEGITNFFAAGDSGSFAINLESFIPATSPGSVPVGGGSVLAADQSGNPFPNTGVYSDFCYNFYGNCIPIVVNLANASQILDYTYWSYGFGLSGDYQGLIGGGFGQSISVQQPWWEHGLDIYNTGQMIIPVVSGSADFEMSVYSPTCPYPSICPTGWQFAYGGTSFATPIQAGEWALIESEVSNKTGLAKDMGDINPLLTLAHNAQQITQVNPYKPMTPQQVPTAFMSAGAENYFDSYLLSLGYTYPVDRNLPAWYATMNNPQGSNWNYLQGLGMTYNLTLLADAIQQLALPEFRVTVNLQGGFQPFTSLTGNSAYTFRVEYSNGTAISGHASVVAYSGDTYNSSGANFIPGSTQSIVALSGGQFTYTPVYTDNSFNAPEYAYFIINGTTFVQYQVTPPYPTQGTLQVGIDTPYGLVTSSSAQVPMFTMVDAEGFYQAGVQGVVLLNGQPVSNAVVTEVAVQVNYSIVDPTFPSSSYSAGVPVGTFITDGRGNFYAWTNAFIAENNGPVPTQVFEVYAQYGALKSQPIYVYVEPQNGIFYASLYNNYQNNRLVGAISFTQMRYVTNITVYTNDGQKVTEVFPSPSSPFSGQSGNATGVFQGVVPINFTLPAPGTPSVVNIIADGQNNETFGLCFSVFCFNFLTAVSSPITWQYSLQIPNPGPQPTATLSVPQGIQHGKIAISWQGSWEVPSQLTSQLLLISQSGTQQVLAANKTSGSISFDTSSVPDGLYTVEFVVNTPTGLSSSAQAPLAIANTLFNQVSSLQGQVDQLSSIITQLDNEVNQMTQQITNLQGQVKQLNNENSNLKLQLENVTQQYNLAQSQISSLNSQIQQLNAQISGLQGDKQQLQNTITQLQSQIGQQQAKMQALNSTIDQLNSLITMHSTTEHAQLTQIQVLVAGIIAVVAVAGISIYIVRKK